MEAMTVVFDHERYKQLKLKGYWSTLAVCKSHSKGESLKDEVCCFFDLKNVN